MEIVETSHPAKIIKRSLMPKPLGFQSEPLSDTLLNNGRAGIQNKPALLSFKTKTAMMTVILFILPVLVLGTAAYTVGMNSIKQQEIEIEQASPRAANEIRNLSVLLQRQLQLMMLATGITSILAIAIALLWAERAVRPTLAAATTASIAANKLRQYLGDNAFYEEEPSFEDELQSLNANLALVVDQSQALLQTQQAEDLQFQRLTKIADQLRQSMTTEALLETVVTEVRQVLGVDRALFFRLEPNGDGKVAAESVAAGFPPIKGSMIIDPCFKERHFNEYQQGRVRAIDNIHQEKLTQCHVDLLSQYAVKANLVAPVLFEGRLRGLLIAHQCSKPYSWQPAEVNFLSRLATQVGYALDQVSLTTERRIKLETERLLSETLARIHDADSKTEALDVIVRETRQILKADRVVFFGLSPEGEGIIESESVKAEFPSIQGSVIYDPCFKERHFEEYRKGRVRAIDNIHQANMADCHINLLQKYAVKANLVAPVIRNHELTGLLIAHQCSRPRVWQPAEVQFFSQFAKQAGYLLDRVGLVSERQVEFEDEQMIGKITRRIRDARSFEETLKVAVHETRKAMKADRVIYFCLQPNGDGNVEAESVASDFPEILGSSITDLCFKERHFEEYRKGRVRAVDNIHKEKLTKCHIDLLSQYAVKANLVAPIICDDQLKGLMIAHQCSGPRAWKPTEVSFFSRLAIQVGYALDRRQFPVDEEAQAAADTFLTDLAQDIHKLLDADEILSNALAKVRAFFECDRTLFFQLKPESNEGVATVESVANGFPAVQGVRITDPCFNTRYVSLYNQGRVRAIDDIHAANLSECHLEMLRQFSVKSDLIAPVIQNGQLIGLIMAHQCAKSRIWQPVEINIFTKLASQIGYALDRVYLLEQVEQAEHQIENSFLPQNRAFSSTSLGITLADAQQPDYPLIYCNPAFEDMTGYTREETIGRNCRFLQGADTDPEALDEIRKALREQKGCQVRLKNYRKDGSAFWNELNVAPIRDKAGQVTHFIGIQMDASHLQWDIQQIQTLTQSVVRVVQDEQSVMGSLSQAVFTQAEQLALASETSQSLSNHIQALGDATRNALSHIQLTHENIESTSHITIAPIKNDIASLQTLIRKSIEKISHLKAVADKIDTAALSLQEFATKTNMLVLNLAVRAENTEESDGQALIAIAEAVRSLSTQAESASTGVMQVASEIQAEISETLITMDGDSALEVSLLKIEEMQQQLAHLVSLSSQNSQLIEGIANAVPLCAEGSHHLSQITQAMVDTREQTAQHTTAITVGHQQILEDIQELQSKADVL
jgi:methyl-accepting chemotaxis protein PixJ